MYALCVLRRLYVSWFLSKVTIRHCSGKPLMGQRLWSNKPKTWRPNKVPTVSSLESQRSNQIGKLPDTRVCSCLLHICGLVIGSFHDLLTSRQHLVSSLQVCRCSTVMFWVPVLKALRNLNPKASNLCRTLQQFRYRIVGEVVLVQEKIQNQSHCWANSSTGLFYWMVCKILRSWVLNHHYQYLPSFKYY